MIYKLKAFIRSLTPKFVISLYHYCLSFFSALFTGFPAKDMTVILVTGTKGKSTVSEMVHHILKETGHAATLISTIHFVLPEEEIKNDLKMTMPGRGRIHRLLAKAKKQGAEYAVIEATSEGTSLYRHTFLFPDILVFTNLHKEHIESHGSFENYKAAKLKYAKAIQKNSGAVVAHADDIHAADFLSYGKVQVPYRESELGSVEAKQKETFFTYKNVAVTLPLPGIFNALNALAAFKVSELLGVTTEKAGAALQTLTRVRGRTEFIDAGQNFSVIVDYAHTPDSLKALYSAFPDTKKLCILGNTGGGRDTWKRPLMGEIAEEACDEVIFTNEDPYDEDPEKIIREMAAKMQTKPTIIMDRREAINYALTKAPEGGIVIISGKGTDPYIMEAGGKKTPWDDATVVREELAKVLGNNL